MADKKVPKGYHRTKDGRIVKKGLCECENDKLYREICK